MDQIAAFKAERITCDGVESSGSWDTSFILENDGQDSVLSDSGLAELEHGSAVSIELFGLLNLESGQSTFSTELETKFASLGLWVAAFNHSFEDASVLLHLGGVEANSHVLMLVGVDGETVGADIKGETF